LRLLASILVATILTSATAALAEEDPVPEPLGPYCACYETEPAMDFGGRTVASIQGLASGLLRRGPGRPSNPAVAAAWEIPLALVMLLVQHEVMGHGGRAREFNLGPSYGLGFDFSAYTTIDRPPGTVEEITLLTAGGVEATGVLSRRLALDLLKPRGAEGSLVPLMLIAKLDLPLYVSQTESPRVDNEFQTQFEDGNDMANYIVSRQGQRVDADPVEVWERLYAIDYADPLLDETFDDLRLTAIWNLLDPVLVTSVIDYARSHLGRGALRVTPRTWQVAPKLGLTAGTRSALGPTMITRFLDFYAVTERGIGNVYVRDLDSSVDRAFGFGAGFHRVPVGSRWELGVQADSWQQPTSLEQPGADDSQWNVSGELAWSTRRWGLTAKLGAKSEGFLPGLPNERGSYLGFGALISF